MNSNTLTDFHLGLSNSNMLTLDKRISASTDQLDCIRGNIIELFHQFNYHLLLGHVLI